MNTSSATVKDVFTIRERESGTAEGSSEFWTRVGVAFVNRDHSLNVHLDANPVNGRLHIRDRRPPRQQNQKGETR
jgi:hypothetical protein